MISTARIFPGYGPRSSQRRHRVHCLDSYSKHSENQWIPGLR
jgi:hypothetical protein